MSAQPQPQAVHWSSASASAYVARFKRAMQAQQDDDLHSSLKDERLTKLCAFARTHELSVLEEAVWALWTARGQGEWTLTRLRRRVREALVWRGVSEKKAWKLAQEVA